MVITFLFILIVLCFPFLKVIFMGPKDVLKMADIYLLAFATLMGSAWLTAFLMFTVAYVDLEKKMDGQLEEFSGQLVKNFQDELGLAIGQLDDLNKNPILIGELEKLVSNTHKQLLAKGMVVTRGHKGALAYSKKTGYVPIPVFSQKIVDRTGAGDAYLALSSICAAGGLPIDMAAFVGNAAGALDCVWAGGSKVVENGHHRLRQKAREAFNAAMRRLVA